MAFGDGTFASRGDRKGYEFKKTVHFEDGSKKRLTVYGKTQKECREKMNAKIREEEKALKAKTNSEEIPLGEVINAWAFKNKFKRVKAKTYDRIESIILNEIQPYELGTMPVRLIVSKDINEHLNHLLYSAERDDGKTGYSWSTVVKTYELLDQYFADVYKDNHDANPMNGVARPERKKNVGELSQDDMDSEEAMSDIVLSDKEIRAFKDFVSLPPQQGKVGRTKHGIDMYFIMMTCARFGEISSVTWADIDFEKREMKINKNSALVKNRDAKSGDKKMKRILTTPKNGKSRIVMLGGEAMWALNIIKEKSKHTEPSNYVLCTDSGKQILIQETSVRLKGVLKGAGLLTPARQKKFGVHYLRHTGISHYLRNGIPIELVAKMAGHSSIAITERVYYHIIHDQQKLMLDMMDNIKI